MLHSRTKWWATPDINTCDGKKIGGPGKAQIRATQEYQGKGIINGAGKKETKK
jgi:hypothetical protein